MPERNFLVYEKIINAPADLIYRAFTSASALREWLCDVSTTDPDEGGWIYLAWHHGYFAAGQYTKLVPNEAVSFTWIGKDEPAWTQVDVKISPIVELKSYKVELHHSGIGNGSEWEDGREEIAKGWKMGLENLKTTLEEGRDLRVTNRPMLGIYIEELSTLTQATRESMHIPVENGVLVSNVVPDFGAETAGIQPNDVIVEVEGTHVDGIRAMGTLISDYTPGDQISVVVFRGAQKMTFIVDTKAQEVQDLPGGPEELAKALESKSSKVLETIENILETVTDAEASYSPGPDAWSVKETLVHLIHNERDLHSWINDLVAGQERFYDEWPGDRMFRIRATLTTYPDMNNLLAELRRSLKETVASVAFLDQDFTRRKASYWRLAMEVHGTTKHIQEHIGQIEANVKAARNAKSE